MNEDPIVATLGAGSPHAGEMCRLVALAAEIRSAHRTRTALLELATVMGEPPVTEGESSALRDEIAALGDPLDQQIQGAAEAYTAWLGRVAPLRNRAERAKTRCDESHERVSLPLVALHAQTAVRHQRLCTSATSRGDQNTHGNLAAAEVGFTAASLTDESIVMMRRQQAILAAVQATQDRKLRADWLGTLGEADVAWCETYRGGQDLVR